MDKNAQMVLWAARIWKVGYNYKETLAIIKTEIIFWQVKAMVESREQACCNRLEEIAKTFYHAAVQQLTMSGPATQDSFPLAWLIISPVSHCHVSKYVTKITRSHIWHCSHKPGSSSKISTLGGHFYKLPFSFRILQQNLLIIQLFQPECLLHISSHPTFDQLLPFNDNSLVCTWTFVYPICLRNVDGLFDQTGQVHWTFDRLVNDCSVKSWSRTDDFGAEYHEWQVNVMRLLSHIQTSICTGLLSRENIWAKPAHTAGRGSHEDHSFDSFWKIVMVALAKPFAAPTPKSPMAP